METLQNWIVIPLLLLKVAFLINGQEDPLVIRTVNGLVRGSEERTEDESKTYYAYRGIPYAEPPIGDLRFRPPLPARNWSGVLNATVDRSKCVQGIGWGSENCLYISVYTPNVHPSDLLPVMVWIYGGFFLIGDDLYTDYGPDYFLNADVVVVSFNYRLGAFGFLSTEDLAAPGNWGTKDQILALKWVQANIENFGGNPKRVTIFGESAGSASVSYLVQSPLTENLFHGAIMQSGTSLDLWALSRHPRATSFNLGMKLGIFTTNTTYLVERLREVEAAKLQVVSSAVDLGETALTNPRDGLIFAPCEEPPHEGAAVLGRSYENLQNGTFWRVPLFIGFNSEEGLPFVELLAAVRLYLVTYDLLPVRLIPIDMNVSPMNALTVALKIRAHYLGLAPAALSDPKLVQYVTDDQFTRPITEAVRFMSEYVTVYYYRFSYQGPLGLNVGQLPRIGPGVGHAEDVNYLWRKKNNIKNPPQRDLLTRRRMIRLWTNFAKTLNPTPEGDPLLQNVTWTPATPETQYYLDIGENLSMQSNLDKYSISWWRQLYKDYGNPPYDTY